MSRTSSSHQVLHPGQTLDDGGILPLEVLQPINGVISLKLPIRDDDVFAKKGILCGMEQLGKCSCSIDYFLQYTSVQINSNVQKLAISTLFILLKSLTFSDINDILFFNSVENLNLDIGRKFSNHTASSPAMLQVHRISLFIDCTQRRLTTVPLAHRTCSAMILSSLLNSAMTDVLYLSAILPSPLSTSLTWPGPTQPYRRTIHIVQCRAGV